MEKKLVIETSKSYHETMIAIYEMMNRGEAALNSGEIEQLKVMTAAAEKYEDETNGI